MTGIRPLRRQAVDAVHVRGARSGIRPEAREWVTPAFIGDAWPSACAVGETGTRETARLCREPALAATRTRVTVLATRSIDPPRLQSRQLPGKSIGLPNGPPYAGRPFSLPVRAARFAAT